MRPNKAQRFKGWFLVKKTLLCELFRPHNRVILIVSDNRSTVGIAYPRLYESLAFINGYKKADEAIEQYKAELDNPSNSQITEANPRLFHKTVENSTKKQKNHKKPEKKGLKNLLIWHIIKT